MITKLLTWKIDLPELLVVAMGVLKLSGKIDWAWWWITAPLTIPWALLILKAIGVGLIETGRQIAETRKVNQEELHDSLVGENRSVVH